MKKALDYVSDYEPGSACTLHSYRVTQKFFLLF